MSTEAAAISFESRLGFAKPEDIAPDPDRGGLLRAKTYPINTPPWECLELHTCDLIDCKSPGPKPIDLETAGFDVADLTGLSKLQAVLSRIHADLELTDQTTRLLRRACMGRSVRLATGKKLRILYVADEGVILREAGPNGLPVIEDAVRAGAANVHGDQDVFGTPVRQLLKGLAPKLFRHDSPGGVNRSSPLFLCNLWIPLQQITQPLTLMDRTTLGKESDQLLYSLPVDSFLKRDQDRGSNDIWQFRYHPSQRWYFHSKMDAHSCYVFDTLGASHGAASLPGEDVLEQQYLQLNQALEAQAAGDLDGFKAAVVDQGLRLPHTTKPIAASAKAMEDLLAEARSASERCFQDAAWTNRAKLSMDRVIRRSVEMRAVCWLS